MPTNIENSISFNLEVTSYAESLEEATTNEEKNWMHQD